MSKTRILTHEQHRSRLACGVCPRCGDYRLVRQLRVKTSDTGEVRFAGSYYTCGGPLAHECYHLSGESGTRLSESSEGVDPVKFREPTLTKPVVKRRKKKV